MRRNVDAWWPYVRNGLDAAQATQGVEAIVMTASGCGVTVKEYGHLLRHDATYAEKAARISELSKDIGEVLETETHTLAPLLNNLPVDAKKLRIAFHSPCTLQHGLQIRGVVEKILIAAGLELTFVPDAHLCCGSAGTYSILQPELSQQLLKNKVMALESSDPIRIVTANIGCLMHVQSGTSLPVSHWIEVLDEKLSLA